MVEVIKPGDAASWSDFQRTITCKEQVRNPGGCGAILSITANDLRPYHWFGTHFKHEYVAVICPLCSHVNGVYDVPQPIRKKVLQAESTFDGLDDRIY